MNFESLVEFTPTSLSCQLHGYRLHSKSILSNAAFGFLKGHGVGLSEMGGQQIIGSELNGAMWEIRSWWWAWERIVDLASAQSVSQIR